MKKLKILLFVLAIICYFVLYAIRIYHSQYTTDNCSPFLTTVGNNKIFKKEITKIEIKHGYDYITTLTSSEDIETICNFVKLMSGNKCSHSVLITTWVYSIQFYTSDDDFLSIGISPGDFRMRKSYNGDIYFYKADKIYYDEFKELLNTIMSKYI